MSTFSAYDASKDVSMETVSIRSSAKIMCEPLTVNRLLKAVRTDDRINSVFWPRLLKDRTVNNGRKVSIKLDRENLEYLRTLKKHIRETYGVFEPYSMLVCCSFITIPKSAL